MQEPDSFSGYFRMVMVTETCEHILSCQVVVANAFSYACKAKKDNIFVLLRFQL